MLRQNKIVRAGKNSGPVLRHLWTKVREILGQHRRPLVLSNAFARLSMSRFVQQIFAIKSRSRQKPNKCKRFLAPTFQEGRPKLFYSRLLARITVHRLAKCGWVPFRLLISVCESWQWSGMQNFRRVGENSPPIWSRLWTNVHVYWDDVGDFLSAM